MIRITKASLFDPSADVRSAYETLRQNPLRDVGLTWPWMSALWKSHFGPMDGESYLLQGDEGPIGMVPLYFRKERFYGLALNVLRPISGLYSTCGGLPIVAKYREVLDTLLFHSALEFRWDIFECCLEAGSQMARALGDVARTSGGGLLESAYENAPFIKLDGTLDDFLAKKSGNFRSNLKRKEKKLEKAGALTFETFSQPDQVVDAMRAILVVEGKSWKAGAGSAINSSERREAFYQMLAERCAVAGWLRLYLLKLNDTPIAFDFGLLFRQRYFMLKTSYDEHYSDLSPGVVLRWYVVRNLFQTGAIEHDFMWGEEPYKVAWANGMRKYKILRVYSRNFKAKLAYGIYRMAKVGRAVMRDNQPSGRQLDPPYKVNEGLQPQPNRGEKELAFIQQCGTCETPAKAEKAPLKDLPISSKEFMVHKKPVSHAQKVKGICGEAVPETQGACRRQPREEQEAPHPPRR